MATLFKASPLSNMQGNTNKKLKPLFSVFNCVEYTFEFCVSIDTFLNVAFEWFGSVDIISNNGISIQKFSRSRKNKMSNNYS